MKRSRSDAARLEPRSNRARSAISNGTRLPGGVKACSAEGRRFTDVMHDLTIEMGGSLTHAEELQVRMIAGLILHAEQIQARILRGEEVDSDQFTRVSNSAARALNSLKRSAASRARRQPAGGAAAYLQAKREGGQA